MAKTSSARSPAKKPAARPRATTLGEFVPLRPAESALLVRAAEGRPLPLQEKLPAADQADKTIRGDFLRFIVLGGSKEAPVFDGPLVITGAVVEGELVLDDVTITRGLNLLN